VSPPTAIHGFFQIGQKTGRPQAGRRSSAARTLFCGAHGLFHGSHDGLDGFRGRSQFCEFAQQRNAVLHGSRIRDPDVDPGCAQRHHGPLGILFSIGDHEIRL